MPAFDPQLFRQVVSNFTPPPGALFHSLMPAREMIAELRAKGASYNTIAELLTQCGVPVGRSHIGRFCHEVLGEKFSRKRPHHPRSAPQAPVLATPVLSPSPHPIDPGAQDAQPAPQAPRSKGPRIAHIRPAQS